VGASVLLSMTKDPGLFLTSTFSQHIILASWLCEKPRSYTAMRCPGSHVWTEPTMLERRSKNEAVAPVTTTRSGRGKGADGSWWVTGGEGSTFNCECK
jgi:hypothetical protein